ncbi:MAG: sigma-70 family RNA polymerase sigma factor [Syntrophobacteraceae bacterium]
MNDEKMTDGADDGDERRLVASAARGDRGAFDQLIRAHMNRVFNLCSRMMGDHEEAGDCAQDTFLKAYRSLKNFRGESSFSTWMCSIAVNTCKTRLQSAAYRYGRHAVSLASAGSSMSDAGNVDPPDPAPTVLETIERHEMERSLHNAIQALPTDARTVIVLRDVEGFSYEEISRMTGWPIGTVKSRIARARDQLRESIRGVH